MQVEGNTGNDLSLIANAADIASLRAQAGNGSIAFSNRTFTNGAVSPGDLTSTHTPTAVAMALLTPTASGLFFASFNFTFSLSATDTVVFAGVSLKQNPPVTVSGGINTNVVGSLVYEEALNLIVTTGGAGPSFASSNQVVPAASIANVYAQLAGPALAIGRTPIAIGVNALTVGGANITGISMHAIIFELP